MSKQTPKCGIARDPEQTVTRRPSGRFICDERGNRVWQWAVVAGETAIDAAATARLDRLEAALALADDVPLPSATVEPNPMGVVQGYSPYDSGPLDKQRTARKRTNLRRLGEYIKLRRQASANKRDPE